MMTLIERFNGKLPKWLEKFNENPDLFMANMIVGRASLGHLSGAEPTDLILDWLQGLGDCDDFANRVDTAISHWIECSWGDKALASAAHSNRVTAAAWYRVGDVVANDPRMKKSAKTLRDQIKKDNRIGHDFLSDVSIGVSSDSKTRIQSAIAKHEEIARNEKIGIYEALTTHKEPTKTDKIDYGWFSLQQRTIIGSSLYKTPTGTEIEITEITHDRTTTSKWDDIKFVGEVLSNGFVRKKEQPYPQHM